MGILAGLAIRLALADDWPAAGAAVEVLAPYLAAGFVAQVLLGALSYLIPVVLGGGPSVVRAVNRVFDTGGAARVTMTNLGLLVCVLPVPSLVRVLASILVLGALAAFVPLLCRAVRVRRRSDAGAPAVTERPRGQNTGLAAVGLAAVLLVVALGGSLDPASLAGPADSAAAGVTPTGRTVSVTVTARDLRFILNGSR